MASKPKKPAATEAAKFPRKAIPCQSGPSDDEKGRTVATVATVAVATARKPIPEAIPASPAKVSPGDTATASRWWLIHYPDREAVKKACRLLFEYGWLIELDAGGATGGRPADPVYAVSPAVRVAV